MGESTGPSGPGTAPIAPTAPTGVRLAADLDRLDRAALDRLQADNIAAMAAALRRGPAWRHWFGPGEHRLADRADLAALPLFTPADLAGACPPGHTDLLIDGHRAGLVLRSSGTTGRRKTLYHSWAFSRRVTVLGARGARASVAELPARVANRLHPAELNGAFGFCQELTAELGAQSLPIGTGMDVEEFADVVAEHAVDAVVTSPGAAHALFTDDVLAERLRPVRVIWYIGENLGRIRRERLAAARPDLSARSLAYSTSETGPIGYQCVHQRGAAHHVHEDAVVVEVVDDHTGEPVPPGGSGQVVVSVVSDTGMPLLRYVVGDRGHLDPEPCPCGSAAATLVLEGRSGQSMNVESTTISQELVMEHLAGLGVSDPADCQFQVLRGPDGFAIRLLVAGERHPVGFPATEVEAALRRGYHLGRVFTTPNFRGLSVQAGPVRGFERNRRGKTPFFVELAVDDLTTALGKGAP